MTDLDRVEPECAMCSDTGWRLVECAGDGVKLCGRRRQHAPHEFAKPCECRPINRTYQEKQRGMRRVA